MTQLRFQNSLYTPGKIVCVGRNYVAHIQELGNEVPAQMVVFNKPASALSDTLYAFKDEALHYEGEISLLVRDGKFAAVAFGLDITKRKLQSELKSKGLPWERAKAFDGAVVLSEFVSLPASLDTLELKLYVNDELRQQGGVPLMLYKPEAILAELSNYTTLSDNDVIMTGTPSGVGEIIAGDIFRGQIFAGTDLLLEASWVAQP